MYSILQDATGFMWFGTEDGLSRYDGARIIVYRHDPANPDSLSTNNFGEVYEDRSRATGTTRRTPAAWRATRCEPFARIPRGRCGWAPTAG